MDLVWYFMLAEEVAQPLGEIADNLAYVLRELPGPDMPEDTRRAVAEGCERFRSVVEQEKARVAGALEGARARALDAQPGGWDVEDPRPLFAPVLPRLDEQVQAFDALVRRLRGDPGLATPEVLLNESGGNILRVLADLRPRLGRLLADPPERTQERHVLRCAVCGRPAVSFELNLDRSTGRRVLRYRGLTCSYELPVADAVLGWARTADAGALHRHMDEGVDAYCPDCDRVYCREHYQTQVSYDEGFYDCTHGTCPAGHRRMIDD